MKRILTLSLALFFGFISISNAQVDDEKSRAILNKISAKAKTFKSVKFEFTYRMVDKAHNIDEKLNGTIVVQGEKFNLNFMGRNIISDGKTVWAYDPDAEEIQVSNVDVDNEAFNPGKLLTSYDDNYRSKLIKVVKKDGIDYYVIDLYPKEGKSFFKIRLMIDKKKMQVSSGTVFGKDNVNYTYTINKYVVDLDVGANYFVMDLKKYPDADVVDLR